MNAGKIKAGLEEFYNDPDILKRISCLSDEDCEALADQLGEVIGSFVANGKEIREGVQKLKGIIKKIGNKAGKDFVRILKDETGAIGTDINASKKPTVNWGQQEKHFPGHNSYTPGRSTMTSNPEKLAEKAGKGQQVGNKTIGTPGSKERVDFGEPIGTYIDEAGNATTTTKGIIHYGKKGIHVVPARP